MTDPENERLRRAIWCVIDDFEGAIANFERRGKGGQHVSYMGPLANLPPSGVSYLQCMVRDLRSALQGKWPMTRAEWMEQYPGTSEDALDSIFRRREP